MFKRLIKRITRRKQAPRRRSVSSISARQGSSARQASSARPSYSNPIDYYRDQSMSSDEYTTHHDLDDLYPRVEYTKLAFKKQPSKYLTPVKRQGTIYTSLLK